jgi:hypothetical protein
LPEASLQPPSKSKSLPKIIIKANIKMPSQTPTPIALPVPRRRSPLLTNPSLGQDITLSLSTTLNMKAKSPYMFISRMDENDYAPPAPPPPSPVNFPTESWSTACRR